MPHVPHKVTLQFIKDVFKSGMIFMSSTLKLLFLIVNIFFFLSVEFYVVLFFYNTKT